MTDLIIAAVLLAIVAAAARYVIKSRKSGAKCIGCPEGVCPHSKGQTSGCSCESGNSSCGCHAGKE